MRNVGRIEVIVELIKETELGIKELEGRRKLYQSRVIELMEKEEIRRHDSKADKIIKTPYGLRIVPIQK